MVDMTLVILLCYQYLHTLRVRHVHGLNRETLAYLRVSSSIQTFDRLGRSLVDLNNILIDLIAKSVSVFFTKENMHYLSKQKGRL